MTYHSKRDWWLIGVVWIPIVLLFLVGIVSLFLPGGDTYFGWTFVFIGVFTAGLVLLLTYPLYYEITPSKLIVRCGVLIRKEIPLSKIRNAYPNKSPASAPAWSLDRIRIDYQNETGTSFILISPADKLDFLGELERSTKTHEITNSVSA
jgi:Bacterial PH domain